MNRRKEILEQISKPRFYSEFENRGFFSTATQQGRKGRDFQTPNKNLGFDSCSNIPFSVEQIGMSAKMVKANLNMSLAKGCFVDVLHEYVTGLCIKELGGGIIR